MFGGFIFIDKFSLPVFIRYFALLRSNFSIGDRHPMPIWWIVDLIVHVSSASLTGLPPPCAWKETLDVDRYRALACDADGVVGEWTGDGESYLLVACDACDSSAGLRLLGGVSFAMLCLCCLSCLACWIACSCCSLLASVAVGGLVVVSADACWRLSSVNQI